MVVLMKISNRACNWGLPNYLCPQGTFLRYFIVLKTDSELTLIKVHSQALYLKPRKKETSAFFRCRKLFQWLAFYPVLSRTVLPLLFVSSFRKVLKPFFFSWQAVKRALCFCWTQLRFVGIELKLDNPFIIYRPVHIMKDVSFSFPFFPPTSHTIKMFN